MAFLCSPPHVYQKDELVAFLTLFYAKTHDQMKGSLVITAAYCVDDMSVTELRLH